MIRCGRDIYMTVWTVENKDSKVTGRGSTSRKNQQNGEYVNSNWNLRFCGEAASKVQGLVAGTKIKINPANVNIENVYLPEKGDRKATNYLTVSIFDFELANGTGFSESTNTKQTTTQNDDELPF